MDNGIHPAPAGFTDEQISTDPILHFFHFAHLPAALQAASKPFCALALHIVETLPRNAERTVALRKLLEAKDAAVRANVGPVKEPKRDDWLADGWTYDQMRGKGSGIDTRTGERRPMTEAQWNSGTKWVPKPAKPGLGEPVETGGHDEDRDGPVPFGS